MARVENLFAVEGKSIVVTGAASGIGLAIAEAMATNGAKVTMADRDEAAVNREAMRLRDAGYATSAMTADITQDADVRRLFDSVIAREGRLDVVFANAGISGGPGFLRTDNSRNPDTAFEAIADELWDRVIDTNVHGVIRTLRAAIPQMKKQGGGKIVVTSSISSMKIEQYVGSSYVVSKAAVGQIVRQVAIELAGYNINVNAIAPGPAITNIGGGRLKDAAARAPFEKVNPMHRVATPEDMQGAALFLASRASDYITGIHIVIDGGLLLGQAD
ncbi:SDR family NAD(P)-dependent oxidoreductase [Methylocella sp. CPCC 101449]|uniref:SDR family NAD(P)-dependent oxidoreductase n=1 Tax=Methylocella sp. CPCC 101449 TaxID=2987531 RepID=UPI00288FE27F|nr:SDR family NAD(P)-dependent oxidoreductase [Methylocella sp. CPCC 101449]MDT2019218.1 SDR family oxidoreductase [Methylocella sp. CPCC 101449]